jgi:hypothetical protein
LLAPAIAGDQISTVSILGLRLFELARVLVCFNHLAGGTVNSDHGWAGYAGFDWLFSSGISSGSSIL